MTSSNPDPSSGGQYSSMRLDLNGFPVISHYDPANGDLRLTRCYDPSCVLANTNVVDAGAGEFVGQFTSLQLDSFDTPVISYYNATTGVLKLAHCQDLDCADPASINTVDDTSDMGQYSSLALAQDGNPVISYYDAINGNLVLARCDDPDCAGGNDQGTSVDTNEGDIGQYSSLALDVFDDTPVIAYYNFDDADLKLVHCDTLGCTGPQSTTVVDGATGEVGISLSMALDVSGNPVISYYDTGNFALNVARCDDPACAVVSVNHTQTNLTGMIDTSIALDPSADLSTDVPVVSYIDDSSGATAVMTIVRCGDPVCSTFELPPAAPDPVPGEIPMNTSLALDLDGNPIVSRFNDTISQLTVVRCTDPLCTPHVKVLSAP